MELSSQLILLLLASLGTREEYCTDPRPPRKLMQLVQRLKQEQQEEQQQDLEQEQDQEQRHGAQKRRRSQHRIGTDESDDGVQDRCQSQSKVLKDAESQHLITTLV
jgi:hypothetical protein